MRIFLFLLAAMACLPAYSQEPQGYYSAAQGLNGTPLRTALFNIIKGHSPQSYNALWTAFQTTDKKADGKVWDVYSDIPAGTPPYEYTFVTDQCGNYTAEGNCYNREHSWPKSYFNDQDPMISDLFHIYPTDGYVNGKRDNDPYGVVDSTAPYWESENGSRSGANIYPGYSGNVFEPIDAYKGDLARSYFYMSTRYYTQDNGWNDWAMANGADLKQWALDMLLEWHHKDPVSQKEIDRNNAIYALQHNRNPFIDHPEYADCIWGHVSCGTQSIATVDVSDRVRISPNPAREQIIVDLSAFSGKEVFLDLVNVQGQPLYHEVFKKASDKVSLDISNLVPGIYWMRLRSDKATGHKQLVHY